MPRERDYRMPEAPHACVVCGRPYDLSRQPFAFGRRTFDLPVCAACWLRHQASRRLFAIASAVGCVGLAVGAAASLITGHAVAVIVGAAFAALLVVPAALAWRRRRPRRVRETGLVLDIPGTGPVMIERRRR